MNKPRWIDEFREPPGIYSPTPFWFWNDVLDDAEIVRQIRDFHAHGVHGFVIHPRVGLPKNIGWMSDRMLDFMRVAVREAERLSMRVVLYDEGMYPSGSSSGQVVAENPAFQCRCLARIEIGGIPATEQAGSAGNCRIADESSDTNRVRTELVARIPLARGGEIEVVDRPVDSVIRGLHYIGEGPEEETPVAADILNPDSVATFIRLVYDRYFDALGSYFGSTITGIFTDEPGLLGRCREPDVHPGTSGILGPVNDYLGYDFTPHLPALWYDDEDDAKRFRGDYYRAVEHRLEETYYRQLHAWCDSHGVDLTGHPGRGDDIGSQRYFHIPGQDTVWRWVLPGPTSLEGAESTQAKATSSAALHLSRLRNSNECFGAYGHEFSWNEMMWLTNWCLIRGVNLLYPHAFYYSIRGPRRDERPPDVGPHSTWWDRYKSYADYVGRICGLNTEYRQVCRIAVLCESVDLPWEAARVCFEHQHDFNYLELRHLEEDAQVSEAGIRIADMRYESMIIDGDLTIPEAAKAAVDILEHNDRIIRWNGETDSPVRLVEAIERLVAPDITIRPLNRFLRIRHLERGKVHHILVANEGTETAEVSINPAIDGSMTLIDPMNLSEAPFSSEQELRLEPYTVTDLRIETR